MGKKLLVADDSLTIQKVIKLALSGDGYEIQTVSEGTECLQQVALFRPDVVLIDVGLPGRSAFELKKAANEDPEMSRIPFVLMSSAFEKVDEAKVALLKFDGRLTKPFDPSNLKSVLTAALQMNSGQTIKEFSPSPAPSSGFSLEPSERSKQMSRPPLSDSEATGEIRLVDPKMNYSRSNPAIPMPPRPDALWSDTAGIENDTDIRNLTESTVKMSGLDDLGGWNIEENAKSSLPPIPDIFTSTQTGLSQHSLSAIDLHPPQPEIHLNEGHHEFDLEIGSPTPTNPSISMPISMPFSDSIPASMPPSDASASMLPSLEGMVEKQVREQLEIMVQGAVKTQLEQMARKALPEIAERVVKAEIRKLLEGLGSKD